MTLGKIAEVDINEIFETIEFPMKVLEFIFWRPVFRDRLFQDFEPLNDIERLFKCEIVNVTFFIEYNERQYEYEIHYTVSDKSLKLDSFKLNYCQYDPEEDVSQIENKMKTLISLVAATVIPQVLNYIFNKQKRGE